MTLLVIFGDVSCTHFLVVGYKSSTFASLLSFVMFCRFYGMTESFLLMLIPRQLYTIILILRCLVWLFLVCRPLRRALLVRGAGLQLQGMDAAGRGQLVLQQAVHQPVPARLRLAAEAIRRDDDAARR